MTFDEWIEGYPVRLPHARHPHGRRRRRLDRLVRPRRPAQGRPAERRRAIRVLPVTAKAAKRRPSPTPISCSGDSPPSGLIGGRMPLDGRCARKAIAPLAQRLGFPVERTAHRHARDRGRQYGACDPHRLGRARSRSAQFRLLPFGGAGPLHATDVATSLGICRFLVPVRAGHSVRAGPDRVGSARNIRAHGGHSR